MTADTIGRIYSMTKPVTSVALLGLVEEARLRLLDPVAKYLPAFASVRVLDSAGALTEADRPVTIRDLLTHTSGLTNEYQPTPVAALYREARIHYDQTRTLAAFVDEVSSLPLAFQPGKLWQYSAGVDVVARIIELVADQPYGDYLRERIFEPLGMVDTGYGVPDDKLDRLAAMYGLPDVFDPGTTPALLAEAAAAGVNERRDLRRSHPTDQPDTFVRGGFGLYSTLNDYLRFAQMLVNHGELDGMRLLGSRTVELMCSNHLPGSLLPFGGPHDPQAGWGFGLGVKVLMDVPATGMHGSVGEHTWPGAANTFYWVDPKEDLVGVLMSQYMFGSGPEDDFHTLAYQAIVD